MMRVENGPACYIMILICLTARNARPVLCAVCTACIYRCRSAREHTLNIQRDIGISRRRACCRDVDLHLRAAHQRASPHGMCHALGLQSTALIITLLSDSCVDAA